MLDGRADIKKKSDKLEKRTKSFMKFNQVKNQGSAPCTEQFHRLAVAAE